MIKKKRFARVFSVVITLILLCTSLFVPCINITPQSAFANGGVVDNKKLYAFVVAQGDTVGAEKINLNFGVSLDYEDNGYGKVNTTDAEKMKESGVPFDYAKVYFRTRNISAIAEQGDYEAVDQTFVIYPDNPYASISINVNQSEFQVQRVDKDNNLIFSNEDTLRSFYAEIDHVEVFGLKAGYEVVKPNETPNISRVKLSIEAGLSVVSQQYWDDGTYELGHLMDISHASKSISRQKVFDVQSNSSFNDVVFDLASVKTTSNGKTDWYKIIKYMSDHDMLKLGIRAGGTAYEEGSVYVSDSYLGVQLFAGDSRTIGAPELLQVGNTKKFSSPSEAELARWFIQFESDWTEDWSISNQYDGTYEGITVDPYFNSNIHISKYLTNANFGQGDWFDSYVENNKKISDVLIIDDLDAVLQGGTMLSTRVWSCLGDYKSYDGDVLYVPVNYRAKVQSVTAGDISYDQNGDVIIGLSVRFSEPMQLRRTVNGEIAAAPSINAVLNGHTQNPVTFKYADGDGTDTFYFETNLTKAGHELEITSIRVDSVEGFDKIFDFAPVSYMAFDEVQNLHLSDSEVTKWISGLTLKCSYDVRTPSVTLDGHVSQMVKTSQPARIKLEKISSGKLYYAWVENESDKPTSLTQATITASGNQSIASPLGITGVRYLYAYAESSQWKQSNELVAGPYYFDNEAPEIDLVSETGNNKARTFTLKLTNNTIGGAGVPYAALARKANMYVATDPEGENVFYQSARTIAEGTPQYPVEGERGFTETTVSFDVTLDMLQAAMEEDWYNGKYYVFFSISDELGNTTTSEPQGYLFDTRDIFEVALDYDTNLSVNVPLEDNYYTLNVASASSSTPLALTFSGEGIVLQIAEFRNVKTGEDLREDTVGIEIAQSTAEAGVETEAPITIQVKAKIDAGLYRLSFKNKNADNQDSIPIYLYVTNGLSEETGMYQSVQMGALTNAAWKIPSNIQYYYLSDKGDKYGESYSSGNGDTYFSSENEVRAYVRYREYLDLYAVTISQPFADYLNSGMYRKADGVTQTAAAGQVWIRYKERYWNPTNSDKGTPWVYYYYNSSLPININALGSELENALNAVTETICSYAQKVDLVTDAYLDKYGSPTLAQNQMHIQAETATASKSGSQFASVIGYFGDIGMYDSSGGALATNVSFESGNRRLFYRYDTSSYSCLDEKFDGKTLGECFNTATTNIIHILELDENGAREYEIRIDKMEPGLKILVKQGKDYKNLTVSKAVSNVAIRGSEFYIEGMDNEDDALAFVAIYRYTSASQGDLLYVYRKSDFDKGQGIRLEKDGKYHLHVSDRSGNDYTFIVEIKSEALVCKPTPVSNSYLRIDVNRDVSEIAQYEVYLNGEILTTDYTQKRFYASGQYRFVIKDIYGNVYDTEDLPADKAEDKELCNFDRNFPKVDWQYQTENSGFANYDKDAEIEKVKMTEVDEQNYIIYTSTYLRFLPMEGCAYEIITGKPNAYKTSTGWIAFSSLTSFTMKVYYETAPEIYVIYTCIVDNTVPVISVSYQKGDYQFFEFDEINEMFAAGAFQGGEGEDFKPSLIGFASKTSSSSTVYLSNGAWTQARYFRVQASDENGVKVVHVYLDNQLIFTKTSNFNDIYLSEQGSYRIVAMDNYGNEATFSFVNEFTEQVQYSVDGVAYPTDISFDRFNDDKVYTKVEPGNTQMEIKLLSSAEIHYIITDESNGETYYFAFVVDNGKLYTFGYTVKVSEGKLNINSKRGETECSSGVVAEIKDNLNVAIYFSKTSAGAIVLTVRSTDEAKKSYTVEARVSTDQSESPYYFKTEISNLPSTLTANGHPIDSERPTKVQADEGFAIDTDNIDDSITSIEVAYSVTGDYTEYISIFDDGYQGFNLAGMYHIKVINCYGVQTNFYVVISSGFTMAVTIEDSEETFTFSEAYTRENTDFYSNKSVKFSIPSTGVSVTERNGKVVSRTENEAQGYTEIEISGPGEYFLTIEDEYGNVVKKNVFIAVNTLTIGEGILTNFTEEDLLQEEKYINREVFINKDAVKAAGNIAFISITYNETTVRVYDQIHEDTVDLQSDQSVGLKDNGDYVLVFRDQYGNSTEIVIHYRKESTLTIMKTTMNSVEPEPYSIKDMLEYGVWTNSSVSFVSVASNYILKVDDASNVTTISYDATAKKQYEVYYLDEYGFEYTFTVYLHREELVIQPAESISVLTDFEFPITKDNVEIVFDNDMVCSYKCTYTLNDSEEMNYNLGDSLYKDGVYRFKVVDLAGNIATYIIRKDSAVEYRLEGTGVGEILVNGGVTNGGKVQFYPENSDTAYIKKVFHNNEIIEYDDVIFTERGKWELLIADEVGNETYFCFYILRGKMNGFTYRAPYDYKILSVTWEVDDSIVAAPETIKEEGLLLEATKNGKYTVTMECASTKELRTFTFTIDTTPPQVSLVGCEENEKTINNVTLKGCKAGDTIYVYKDGKLTKTVRITSEYMDAPTISEAGKYTIVVENEAGIKTELSFERKYVPNVAGSILVIVLALMAVAGLFVGLIWRNHSKTDD